MHTQYQWHRVKNNILTIIEYHHLFVACNIFIRYRQVKVTTPDDRPASDVHVNIKVPQRYINMTYDYKKDYISGNDGIIYVTIPPFSAKSIRIEVSIIVGLGVNWNWNCFFHQ